MNCDNMLEGYFNFLRKDLTEIREKKGCKLELPFPKPAGDPIIINIKKDENGYYQISDDCYIFDYLLTYGIHIWKLTADAMRDYFRRVILKYNILEDLKPEIVITSKESELYQNIFQMSNLLNELVSIKLLITPVTLNIFKKTIQSYFRTQKITHIPNDSIKILRKNKEYSFKFEFHFPKETLYTKIITSNDIIKNWAVNFDQIKRHYEEESVKLWAIYNDNDNIDASQLEDFLGDYADDIIAWSKEKERFLILK